MSKQKKKDIISWDFISQFSFHNPPKIVLERSPEVNRNYLNHGLNLKKKGTSVSCYLKTQFFPNGSKDVPYLIVSNNYPYNMENGIQHFLLWFNPDTEFRFWIQDFQKVKKIIADYCAQGNIEMETKCVYFQNLENMRSVKAIPHIHIFWKKK